MTSSRAARSARAAANDRNTASAVSCGEPTGWVMLQVATPPRRAQAASCDVRAYFPAMKRLPRTVLALGLVSLLNDASSEMIYPLLPAFLATVLGAGAMTIGAIEGTAESV